MKIDAKGMHYRQLNKLIRDAVASGEKEFELDNIGGQRYIGDGLNDSVKITVNGTPGNDRYRPSDPAKIPIQPGEGEATVPLKIGQTLDRTRGEISDGLGGGEIAIRKSGAPAVPSR